MRHKGSVRNDGSTDETADVLATFGDQIIVLHQRNGGVSAASNVAILHASSNYVTKLDADDELLPDYLASVEAFLADHDREIVTVDAIQHCDGGPSRRYYDETYFPELEEQDVAILRDNFVYGGASVKRDAFLDIGGFDTSLDHRGEYEGWLRMILGGARAGLIREPLAVYHQIPGSLSSDPRPSAKSVISVLEQIRREWLPSPEQDRAASEFLAENRRRLAVAEADRAILDATHDARKRSWAVAADSAQSVRLRVRFAAAVLSPGLVRRIA